MTLVTAATVVQSTVAEYYLSLDNSFAMHCPHMPQCPGCPRFGSDSLAPKALEQLRELGEKYGLKIDQSRGARRDFRRRARLSVRGRVKSPKVGVFEARSHQVADIPHCSVHHPVINLVASQLKAGIQHLRVPPYSDRANAGLIRGVQVVVQRGGDRCPSSVLNSAQDRAQDRAQVTIIGNSQQSSPAQPLLTHLREHLGDQLHSLWWNGHAESTNRILGPHWEHICGPDMLEEQLGGSKVFFPPGAFGQNNLDVFDQMVAQVHQWVPNDSDVLELYCGTGSLGLGLLPVVRSLIFNEIGEASLLGLERGLSVQPDDCRSKATIAPGTAESVSELLASHQVVIVDPPRKGMEEAVTAALCQQLPKRLIYVSCGLNSFLRDAQRLAQAGLTPRQIIAYDLFPFTEHVETVALFEPES